MAVTKTSGQPTARTERASPAIPAVPSAPVQQPATPARLDEQQTAQRTGLGNTGAINSNFATGNAQAGSIVKQQTGTLNFLLHKDAAGRAQQATSAPELGALPGSWQDQLNQANQRLGGEMLQAGSSMLDAGGLLGSSPLGNQAVELGTLYQSFGQQLASAPSDQVADSAAVHQRALSLAERGERLSQQGEQQLRSGSGKTRAALSEIEAGAKRALKAVGTYKDDVTRAFDYRQNIAKLGDGDSYAIGVDGFLSIGGARVAGRSSIEVTRNAADDYSVAVSGGLGLGVYGEFGAKVGTMGLAAEASAVANGGGTVEFSFKSKEEATRAAGILLEQAKHASPGGQSSAKNAAELRSLAKNISAVELTGDVTGEVFGILGIKGALGGLGMADLSGEKAIRLEFGDEGAALVLRQGGTAFATGNLGPSLQKGDQYLFGAESAGEVSVALERRYPLPPGIDLDALRKEPVKTLKSVSRQLQQPSTDTLTLGFSLEGGAFGRTGGVGGELSIAVGADDLARSGAIPKALRGDLKGALAALPPAATVSGETSAYQTHGVKLTPYFTVMSFGGGVELLAQRTAVDATSVRSFELPAREAFSGVARALRREP